MTQRATEFTAKAAEGIEYLEGRLAVALPAAATDEMIWMPGGVQEVNCKAVATGQSTRAQAVVTRESAAEIQKQFEAVCKANAPHRPYFDFNHDDAEASFWPTEFVWKDGNIVARGEWSAPGRIALEGKTYRAFSPRFWADTSKKPSPIVCNPAAKLNMGGLVNDPAFRAIEPFFAKRGDEPTEPSEPSETMKKTVAELRAKIAELDTAITALKAKPAADDKTISLELAAKEAEKRETEANLRAEQSEELAAKQRATIDGMNRALAKTAIDAAIKRGAIPPQNKELIAKYEALITADPSNLVIVENLQGNPALADGELLTTSRDPRVQLEAREGLRNHLKGYAELAAKSGKIRFCADTFKEKGRLGVEAGLIYRKEFAGKNFSETLAAFRELIAADYSSASLGVLTGTLVAQRTLELFKYRLPMIRRMSTDFSELPAELNQVINTRIVVVPPTMLFDPTINATTGLPNGWAFNTAAQTTNVAVTMNTLFGVPIRFTMDTLSETARRLFDEQAPGAMYAMAKYFVEIIYALMTPANFNAYANVNGTLVPNAYVTYPKPKVDFGRSSLIDLESAFDSNQVPQEDRTALLIPAYHGALANDPSIVTFFAGQQAPEIITDGELPNIANFKPLKAPNLGNTNATPNLAGFAMQRNAVVLAARLPVNLNEILPGANFGSVSTVTDPDTDLSLQLVQYVNQTSGFAEWRVQAIIGGAVGDNRAGLVITTQ